MGRVDKKVAVVTGAASGIGRSSALCLAKEGAAVVAADLNSQGGEQLIGEIVAAGGRAVFQHTASDESQWVTGTAMIVDGGLTVGPNFSALSLPEPTQSAYVGPSFKR